MRKHVSVTVLATLCLLGASAGAQQSGPSNLERVEVAGRKAAVSQWARAESAHFVVYTDTREEDVTALLDNLEKLDHLLRIYTGAKAVGEVPEPKLTLYYLARPERLRDIDGAMPADTIGLYASCAWGGQGFGGQIERIPRLTDAQLAKGALDPTLSAVFQAYARHFLYRHTDIRVPVAYIEGFAQYFSSVRFTAQEMVVGRVPPALARYLNFLGDGRRYSLEWRDVLEHNLAHARSYGGAAGVQLEFAARSWLLTHYMLSSEDNRQRLSRFLVLVGRGEPPISAFERAVGIQVSDLAGILWRYSLRGVQVLRLAHPELPVSRIRYRALPLAAGAVLINDAALKTCPDSADGPALLQGIAAQAVRFPGAEAPRLALSRAQTDWSDPQLALSGLQPLLQDDAPGVDAEHVAGEAARRLAAASEGEARRAHLEVARRHLLRAQSLAPGSPEVALARFNAEILSPDLPDEQVLADVVAAWKRTHEIAALGRAAALALAYEGRADEAHRALGVLAQDARDASLRAWALQWRSRLEAGVSRGELVVEMRSQALLLPTLKTWTLDLNAVAQEVELKQGLEAAADFIKAQQQQQMAAPPGPGAAKR